MTLPHCAHYACKRHDYEKFLDEWRALGYAVHTYDNNGFHGEDIAVDPLVRDSVVHLLERLGYARAT